jgi:hypothetical protein
MDEEELH